MDHLAQRNPAAAALFQSRKNAAADAARVRRDGDRRCQTMSGAGRHAWRPSRQRCAAPTDPAKISSLLPEASKEAQ